MNQQLIVILAFFGGICLAIQAAFNTQLSVMLKQPILATISTSVSSVVFASLLLLFVRKEIPSLKIIKIIPWHLWFIGGMFSVIGVSIYFFTIPKIGISKMISLGLCGQLVFSVVAGHFGWLNLPLDPATWKKIIGIIAMIIGILFINSK
jgi:transporter family-2 protein